MYYHKVFEALVPPFLLNTNLVLLSL